MEQMPQARSKLTMLVDAAGVPRLDFLDERGKVTYSLPGANKTASPGDR